MIFFNQITQYDMILTASVLKAKSGHTKYWLHLLLFFWLMHFGLTDK